MESSPSDSELLSRGSAHKAAPAPIVVLQLLLGVAAFAVSPGPSSTDTAVRQAEALKQQQQQQQTQSQAAASDDQPPETYPGENQDLGPQMLLKKKKRKPLFEFSNDTMFSWTSNALSSDTNPRSAGIVAETLSLAFVPEPFDLGPGKMGLRSGYRHLLWMYDIARTRGPRASDGSTGTLNGNNFEMSTLFVSSNYSFDENWNASLGLDFNRIMNDQSLDQGAINSGQMSFGSEWSLGRMADPSRWTESYVEWNPNWSLARNIPLGDQTNLILSYNGGYHFTRTDAVPIGTGMKTNTGDKLDNGFSASLSYAPNQKVMLQPNVRVSQSLYTQPQTTYTLRRDRTVTPGLMVIWTPSAKVSLRWSVSADFRHSSDQLQAPNCSKVDASTGVSLNLKF